MLANLSPVWLMVLGFICCLIFLFIFRKIYTFLSIFFNLLKRENAIIAASPPLVMVIPLPAIA